MTDKERIDAFLTTFKDLERELVQISGLKDEYVSFSRALNQIHYNRLNPVIAIRDNYDFLKTASDVRNILSHVNDAITPNESFLHQFDLIAKSILDPLTCYQVATKDIVSCSYGDSLFRVLSLMEEHSLTHIPILSPDKKVLGIFSRTVFFDYIVENKEVIIHDDALISDFKEVTALDNHLNESFLFVARRTSLRKAFNSLVKQKAHDKNVALLLVTENGKKDERLLGVITLTDLAKLSEQSL